MPPFSCNMKYSVLSQITLEIDLWDTSMKYPVDNIRNVDEGKAFIDIGYIWIIEFQKTEVEHDKYPGAIGKGSE